MLATRKPLLAVLLVLTGCGKLADDLFCEPEGCDWSPGEWSRVAALANPGLPEGDPSNRYVGNGKAELLGQAFFFDPAFSGNATQVDAIGRTSPLAHAAKCQPLNISCASCHDLARAGVDTMSMPGHVSVGAGWTDVNALGVVNAAYRPVVFWNGRADSLWALNAVVAESSTTLNGNRVRTARQIADRYAPFYIDVFGGIDWSMISRLPANGKPKAPEYDALDAADQTAVTSMLVNWAKAIAAYEYKLISRNSPFDKFVSDGPASGWISAAARRGARLFVGKGSCVDCHSGPQLTDEQFHNIGVPQAGEAVPRTFDCPAGSDPPNAACDCVSPTALKCAPWGAYDGLRRLRETTMGSPIRNPWLRTGSWSDDPMDRSRQAYIDRPLTDDLKGAWRTPSLRNVAQTAPYMHDGRYATLEEVIWHYNTGGRNAGSEQVNPGGIAAPIKPLMLTEAEVGDLVAFLETLTGEPVPAELTVPPQGVALPTGAGGAGGSCPTGAGGMSGSGGTGGSATGIGGGPGVMGSGGMGLSATGSGGVPGAAGMGGTASAPSACATVPVASALVTDFSEATGTPPTLAFGRPPGIRGRTFATAAPGSPVPMLSVVTAPTGAPALQVMAPALGPTGSPTWQRVGLSFDGCVDARLYNAIHFAFDPRPGGCPVRFAIRSRPTTPSVEDPRGTCTAGGCYPPSTSLPLDRSMRLTIPFASMAFPGNPNLVDAGGLLGVEWWIDPLPSGTCSTAMLIGDVVFVNDPSLPPLASPAPAGGAAP